MRDVFGDESAPVERQQSNEERGHYRLCMEEQLQRLALWRRDPDGLARLARWWTQQLPQEPWSRPETRDLWLRFRLELGMVCLTVKDFLEHQEDAEVRRQVVVAINKLNACAARGEKHGDPI